MTMSRSTFIGTAIAGAPAPSLCWGAGGKRGHKAGAHHIRVRFTFNDLTTTLYDNPSARNLFLERFDDGREALHARGDFSLSIEAN